MNIDRMEFIFWMERILARIDILNDNINDLQKGKASIDGDELLDNQDLLQMLKISNRSLQRYRSSGQLPYYTISGKLYYKLSDIHQFIRESFKPQAPRRNDNKGQKLPPGAN
jgi:Zn-finger domain-containing protein